MSQRRRSEIDARERVVGDKVVLLDIEGRQAVEENGDGQHETATRQDRIAFRDLQPEIGQEREREDMEAHVLAEEQRAASRSAPATLCPRITSTKPTGARKP